MQWKKIFLLLMMLLSLQIYVVSAAPCDEEISYPTGTIWGFSERGVNYELSDESLAEIIIDKDGISKVQFKRPGDVYVTARVPGFEQAFVYLVHVTGDAVDETAVDRDAFAQEVLEIVNQERAKEGKNPLQMSDDLLQAAVVRAEEISRSFSHTRPNGQPFHTVLLKGANYYLGENIAAGSASPKAVMEQWMNSPGHRKNILTKEYKELGVGYIYVPGSEYGHYWVQIFRRR